MTNQCRQILTDQQISTSGPGIILNDIQTLLDCIGVQGVETRSKQGNLPASVLSELNARLSQPIEVRLTRPLLRDYPNVGGLYVLLRVMDLAQASEKRVWINEQTLAQWTSLNPTERYFALLEAWLIHAEDGILGAPRWRGISQFTDNLRFLTTTVSTRWKEFDEMCHVYASLGAVPAWNAQLQARFGLIELQARPIERRGSSARGWRMARARLTPWGRAVAWAICEFLIPQNRRDLLFVSLPEEADFGLFRPVFQPFFPEYRESFKPARPASCPGLYIIKAELDPRYYDGPIWRRLAVPAETSLDDLALAVLDAFRFDNDHLYEFRYRDHLGKTRTYNHPFMNEGPFSDEIALAETGLPVGQTMNFHFDFGDDWRFLLRLERIDPPSPKAKRPKLIASAGKAPRQYADWR